MRDIDTTSGGLKPIILVVSPKPLSEVLIKQFESRFTVRIVTNIPDALHSLATEFPAMVYCSNLFATTKILRLLEAVKQNSTTHIIPLLFGLDLNQPLVTFPGTQWAGRLGLITEQSNATEIQSLLDRLSSSSTI